MDATSNYVLVLGPFEIPHDAPGLLTEAGHVFCTLHPGDIVWFGSTGWVEGADNDDWPGDVALLIGETNVYDDDNFGVPQRVLTDTDVALRVVTGEPMVGSLAMFLLITRTGD